MIFDIQRFSLHDGTGIRTLVFFKGCPWRCLWCSNPEGQAFHPEFLFDSKKCIGCHECHTIAGGEEVAWDDGPNPSRSAVGDAERYRYLCPSEALTVVGEKMDAEAILDKVEKDRLFYREGGGVTLSGGEPFAQPHLARELLEKAKARGMSTCVETCLAVPWADIMPCLPFLDNVYADVKHIDPRIHRSATDGDLWGVLANLRRLVESGVPVSVRTPVIPGFNAEYATLSAIAGLVADMGAIRTMQFIPYHSFGEGKYRLLGREYPYAGVPPFDSGNLSDIVARIASKYRLDISIGG